MIFLSMSEQCVMLQESYTSLTKPDHLKSTTTKTKRYNFISFKTNLTNVVNLLPLRGYTAYFLNWYKDIKAYVKLLYISGLSVIHQYKYSISAQQKWPPHI